MQMRTFRNKVFSIFNPGIFQGWGKTSSYFEGWYFKVVSHDEKKAFAFIPGIAYDESGNGHAFIQILDGKKKTAQYIQFDTSAFIPYEKKFNIAIQDNYFSENELRLNLPGIKAHLRFSGNVPWPKSVFSPGIMGPYTFVPFMECYHGIISMDHSIEGFVTLNDEIIDFTGGRGYIEKDWGKSFPSAYIWMQSNHFKTEGISIKTSVAKIPFMGSSFVGFISGVWLGDRLIRFTTYNQSVLRKSLINSEKVELLIENKNYRLEISIARDQGTSLASPIQGLMDGRIEESMNGQIRVMLLDKKKDQVLLNDIGRNACLEVAGKIEEISFP
jgi:hypothetical protein